VPLSLHGDLERAVFSALQRTIGSLSNYHYQSDDAYCSCSCNRAIWAAMSTNDRNKILHRFTLGLLTWRTDGLHLARHNAGDGRVGRVTCQSKVCSRTEHLQRCTDIFTRPLKFMWWTFSPNISVSLVPLLYILRLLTSRRTVPRGGEAVWISNKARDNWPWRTPSFTF